MTVYIRTAAGNEAALNPNSPLPRKLRSLLISIDGRTRVGTYINSLSSFGDVDALIGSLREAGLIEPADASRQVAGHSARDGQTPVNPDASWHDTDADTSTFSDKAAEPENALARLGDAFSSTSTRAPGPGPDDLASWARFAPAAPPVSRPPPPAALQPAQVGYYAPSNAGSSSSTAQYQLRNAISLMSDFVSGHLPADALEIVLALEGLGSVEQVLASLKGYEALIAPAGEPARAHLAELRAVLARL